MDFNLLVGNWEVTGLLDKLSDFHKTRMALKLEILARHLLTIQDQPNYQRDYGQIEVLIFPLLRRICVESENNWQDNSYIFHGGVNPLRVLDEFKTWWNGDNIGGFNHAELLSVYSEMVGPRFRNDNYVDPVNGPIEPIKFMKKHKL